MKIYGIGVDLIKIKRIKKLLKSKKNSKKRLFTIHENKISRRIRNKEMYFAKRFAAKEAFSKALKCETQGVESSTLDALRSLKCKVKTKHKNLVFGLEKKLVLVFDQY